MPSYCTTYRLLPWSGIDLLHKFQEEQKKKVSGHQGIEERLS